MPYLPLIYSLVATRERSPNSFQLIALEEKRVCIYDLELQKEIGEFKIPSVVA